MLIALINEQQAARGRRFYLFVPAPWKSDCLACCHSIKKENNDTLGKTKRSCLRRTRVFYLCPCRSVSVPQCCKCWKSPRKIFRK